LNKVLRYDGEKLKFNVANNYDLRMVARHLQKQGIPTEWAKDLTMTPNEDHKEPVNINGKIKYSSVK